MAQRKIIWSHRANIRLFQILDFYSTRNKSTAYSQKLYKRFVQKLSILTQHSEIGAPTEEHNIKGLIVDDFILFYEITTDKIIVHTVWDNRQNPDDLKLK